MMRCEICKRGPIDGATIYRKNPKGEAGIWRCEEHLDFVPPTEVLAKVAEIEKGRQR